MAIRGRVAIPVKSPSSRSTVWDSASYSDTHSARHGAPLDRAELCRGVAKVTILADTPAHQLQQRIIAELARHAVAQVLNQIPVSIANAGIPAVLSKGFILGQPGLVIVNGDLRGRQGVAP